jgi:hypothetical protein
VRQRIEMVAVWRPDNVSAPLAGLLRVIESLCLL